MLMSKTKRLAAAAALGALMVTASGAAAQGPGEGTPGDLPQASCLGQISANGVLLLGLTPAERSALMGFATAGEWQQNQLACQEGVG
jgi:hypothetical protein